MSGNRNNVQKEKLSELAKRRLAEHELHDRQNVNGNSNGNGHGGSSDNCDTCDCDDDDDSSSSLTLTVLSGERVSQMTKTYADVDAVQRLLEEKEKDLELAARIGQQLLEQNRILEDRVACLEVENKDVIESLTQLKHELAFKTQLIEIYNENTPSEENSKAGTPVGSVATVLERRVATLEEENQHLRSETSRMAEDVEKIEAEEKYLVDDAIKRLSETNSRVTKMSDELQKKNEENAAQQEEIALLVEDLKAVAEINKEFFEENRQLNELVDGLKVSQNELSAELIDLKENYVEVVGILKETQEQLREAQKRRDSGADVISVFDSLAYEIESSVARQRHSSDYFRRCFDTVRCVNNKLQESNSSLLSQSSQLMSSASSGYHSGIPSLDASSCASMNSHEMMILMNPASLSISGSDLGSSSLSMCASPGGSTPSDKYSWRLPEKLQIVKPLEGSTTLQVWSSLATPHLGNLLDKRPGIQMRVERPVGEIGMLNVLSLTEGELTTLQNVSSTPTVFTFVTTSTNWPERESTTTVYSSDSTSKQYLTCSTSSSSSTSGIPLAVLGAELSGRSSRYTLSSELGYTDSGLVCDTPQNSPMDGNTRPASPIHYGDGDTSNQTFKRLGKQQNVTSTDFGKTKKYDLMSKIGSIEVAAVARKQSPAKPGTGALDKILESQ